MKKLYIEKELYKQSPNAQLSHIRKGVMYYTSFINDENDEPLLVTFEVPTDDMGDADFFTTMPAKQLRRWLKIN